MAVFLTAKRMVVALTNTTTHTTQAAEFHSSPLYTSVFVVRKGAKIAAPEDLRGRVLAYNDDESLSGYHIAKFWLVARGETGAFFSSTLASVSDTVFFLGSVAPPTHTHMHSLSLLFTGRP